MTRPHWRGKTRHATRSSNKFTKRLKSKGLPPVCISPDPPPPEPPPCPPPYIWVRYHYPVNRPGYGWTTAIQNFKLAATWDGAIWHYYGEAILGVVKNTCEIWWQCPGYTYQIFLTWNEPGIGNALTSAAGQLTPLTDPWFLWHDPAWWPGGPNAGLWAGNTSHLPP